MIAPSAEVESPDLNACLAQPALLSEPGPETGGRAQRTRQHPRQGLLSSMELINVSPGWVHGSPIIHGECRNISERGLYGTVPVGFGMAIGQEYLFRFSLSERGPHAGSLQTVAREGVVVRTELVLGTSGDRIGIGVRWCGQRGNRNGS